MVRIAHVSDFHVVHTTANLSRMWRLFRPLRRGEGMLDILTHLAASSWVERRSLFEPLLRVANMGEGYSSRALIAVLESARDVGADHLIMTGDAANLGASSEMREAKAVLDACGWSGERLTIVPGNHDVVNFRGVAEFGQVFDAGPWPNMQHITDDVAVIGLDSNVSGADLDWRDMLTMNARGRLSIASIERTDELLAGLPDSTFKILCCHHHLVDLPPDSYVDEWSGKVDPRLSGRAENAEALLDVAANRGVGLLLFGHRHKATHHLFTVRGIPAACSGAVTHPLADGSLRYRIYDIEGGKIVRRRWIKTRASSVSPARVKKVLDHIIDVPDPEKPSAGVSLGDGDLEDVRRQLRDQVKKADRQVIEQFRRKMESYHDDPER